MPGNQRPPSRAACSQHLRSYGLNTIMPNVPARLLLGPAAKYRWLAAPFFPSPSPKSIPHSWSITIGFPLLSFTVPTNRPLMGSKALIVPELVLLEIRIVLLSGPKFFVAAAMPHG